MKAVYILSILVSILFTVSCKKELDPLQDNIGTPEFFVSGSLDTAQFDFQAGNNNYYMLSDFTQLRDTNGDLLPISLRSYLSVKGCPNCRNSVSIYVMNKDYDSSYLNFDIDSVFYVGRRIPVTSDSAFNVNLFTPNKAVVIYNSGFSSANYSFYSSTVLQPTREMVITNVEPYQNNSFGQKTVKISFDIDCRVTDITRAPFYSLIVSGTFAFAYPSL